MAPRIPSMARLVLSGAAAGVSTTIAFAALHHVLISNIWFSLLPMMAAGAVCGACLAWSYALLAMRRSGTAWLGYNLLWVALFLALGALSLVLYQPVYTIPGLISGIQPPGELLRQAMPLSVAFGVACGVVISLAWARTPRAWIAAIATSLALTVLLGHNAAILGLVEMTQEALPLLVQFYGLIAAIMVGNAAAFYVLERNSVFRTAAAGIEGEDAAVSAGLDSAVAGAAHGADATHSGNAASAADSPHARV